MKKYMLPATAEVTLSEKIRYAVGAIGFPYAVIMFSGLIMYYFTDVLGISAAAAGTLLLIARIWDGINDPMMGVIVDKTHSRWGKARPYIFVGGLLMAVFTYLLFTNPGIESEGGKLAWAYFTYIGFGMTYTMFVMSLKVFSSRLTKDRNGITTLSSCSFIGTSVISIFAGVSLMPFITKFSGAEGDMAKGYSCTALVAAGILIFGTLVLTSIKERDFYALEEGKAKKSYNFATAVKAIFTNKPFLGFCLASAIIYIGYYLSASTVMYYCIYNLGNADYYSFFTVVDYATPIVAALTIPYLVKRFGKRSVLLIAFIGVAAAYGLRYITGDQNVVIMVILATVAGIALGFWNVLFTPMSLDCALYSEYKTGLKMDAIFVTSFTLLTKIASGIGGAVLGFALDAYGYVENAATQTETAMNCLRFCCTAAVTLCAVGSLAVFLLMYKLKDSELEKMNAEVLARNEDAVSEA